MSESELLSVTVPKKLVDRINIESKAKDMSRSRYVLRLLERAYEIEEKEVVK